MQKMNQLLKDKSITSYDQFEGWTIQVFEDRILQRMFLGDAVGNWPRGGSIFDILRIQQTWHYAVHSRIKVYILKDRTGPLIFYMSLELTEVLLIDNNRSQQILSTYWLLRKYWLKWTGGLMILLGRVHCKGENPAEFAEIRA